MKYIFLKTILHVMHVMNVECVTQGKVKVFQATSTLKLKKWRGREHNVANPSIIIRVRKIKVRENDVREFPTIAI